MLSKPAIRKSMKQTLQKLSHVEVTRQSKQSSFAAHRYLKE